MKSFLGGIILSVLLLSAYSYRSYISNPLAYTYEACIAKGVLGFDRWANPYTIWGIDENGERWFYSFNYVTVKVVETPDKEALEWTNKYHAIFNDRTSSATLYIKKGKNYPKVMPE